MKKKVDAQTAEIIASFVSEGLERLDDAEVQLEQLRDSCDEECLNSVFRLFHSVKGSAGFLGFEAIKLLTHEAETLLSTFIKLKNPISPDALDVIYQCIDLLRAMIERVHKDNHDGELYEEGKKQAERVHTCTQTILGLASQAPADFAQTNDAPNAVETKAEAKAPAQQAPALQAGLPFDANSDSGENADEIVLSELVSRDMAERFLAECSDLIDDVERKALSLVESGSGLEGVNDIFRAVHTVKGNAGFFGFEALERRCMDLESGLDKARKGTAPVNAALVNSVIQGVDGIRTSIANVNIIEPSAAKSTAASASMPASTKAAKALEEASPGYYKPIGEILVGIGAASEEEIQRALNLQGRPLGELLVETGSVTEQDVETALLIQKATNQAVERKPSEEIQRKDIRVDTSKLDKLFELVGELITAEAMVYNSPDLAGLKLDSFSKSYMRLNKISREIQETTMTIRMIPLESLFHKMTRLVHDLSRKFGKPVELVVTGQETEMDKNVIEQVSDPLVHILRNALDHGVELPAARAAASKPENATIKLSAKYEGSEIWISVKDDGAGLNRDRILKKAKERGLLKVEPDALADEDVWAFIFEPGFSTAEVVSEVSGRGVGLDVVRKNLERIRGAVEIRTESGVGTEFILKIPLTMAIIDGITLRAGGNFYSIPLGEILEFFKVSANQITETVGGEQIIDVRGSLMPLLKLGEIFNIPGAAQDPLEGIVIVIHSGDMKACLLIDEVVGNQQIVVKSLSDFLGRVEGLSGCSILGDGTVSFIIDTARLMSLRLE